MKNVYILTCWICEDGKLANSRIHSKSDIESSTPDYKKEYYNINQLKKSIEYHQKETTESIYIQLVIYEFKDDIWEIIKESETYDSSELLIFEEECKKILSKL